MTIQIPTSLIMIVEQNYTTTFPFLLNQTDANMVNQSMGRHSQGVSNLSYHTKVLH